MLIQVLRPGISLLRQRIGIFGFEVVGTELRVIWTRDIQHRFGLTHFLPGNHDDSADRAAHLSNDRRGAETVVSNGTRQAQGSSQRRRLNCQDLNVRHLVRWNRKQLGAVGTGCAA